MCLPKKEKEKLQDWYFTFGVGHGNRMFYVKINGSYSGTRERMVELFRHNWAFQYSEKEFGNSIKEWNYKLHPICNIRDECKVGY